MNLFSVVTLVYSMKPGISDRMKKNDKKFYDDNEKFQVTKLDDKIVNARVHLDVFPCAYATTVYQRYHKIKLDNNGEQAIILIAYW